MNNTESIIMRSNGAFASHLLPEQVLFETSRGAQPVSIVSRAYDDGIIYINGPIDETIAGLVILALQIAAKRRKKLKVYINSPGGSVLEGLAIYDAMKAYPYDIDIICVGLAASMAAVLLAGGRKGHRFIMPHSKVMIHEPLIPGGLGGSATSIQRTAESIIETKKILNGLLAEFTGKAIEEIDENTAFDNFFNAEEAIEFGLCDKIATGYEDITEEIY